MRIVDLTREVYPGLQTWPTPENRMFLLEVATHELTAPLFKEPCKGYAENIMIIPEHYGTHVDSPFHFVPNLGTIDKVPPETFMGEAVYIDVSSNPDEFVTKERLKAAAKEQGVDIKKGDIVLLRVWPGQPEDSGYFDCKVLSEDAAEWLRDMRIKVLGVNTGAPDWRGQKNRIAHLTLLGAGICVIEQLVNLEKIGKPRFQFVGLPLRVRGATGSPIRALAIVQNDDE